MPGLSVLTGVQQRVLLALLGLQRQSWEQGVAGHAVLDLGCDELAEVLARGAVARQTAAGKLAEIDDDSIVNCAANGEAVLRLGQRTGEPGHRQAFDRQLDWLLRTAPRASDGTLFHLEGSREVWVDSVYMLVPLLALTGHVQEADTQLTGHRERLFDAERGLYAHKFDEDSQSLSRSAFWGSGNGWVVAGLARAIRHLGKSGPDGAAAGVRRTWAAHARTVLDACLECSTDGGRFHDVLDDRSTFADGTVALMLSYAASTGVADGWLPPSYAAVGESLLDTVARDVTAGGLVSGVCGSPGFDRPGHSAEAQAFFLLASAARRRSRMVG